MAGQRMRCRKCRDRFTRPSGSRRLDCEKCSPPRLKSEPATAPLAEMARARVDHLRVDHLRGELEQATHDELAGRGRQATTAGVLALTIARSIDHGGHTGSQMAALAARLLDATAVALKGAPKAADAVDELQAMRERIRGA